MPKSSRTKSRRKSKTRLTVEAFFSASNKSVLATLKVEKRTITIQRPGGETVFQWKDAEVPKDWSQLASDILVSKYFRKTGVPPKGKETSVKQVLHRITSTIAKEGFQRGYFDQTSAKIFEQELNFLLAHQYGAFNSPVWFNVGLFEKYGIKGSGGNYIYDEASKKAVPIQNNYEHPQSSACFIQSIADDLMSIFELAKTEAKIFKYGSGTGTNFSNLRGSMEPLSGGGKSSGLMSFLEVLDRGAAATKSGGTTRRAAKMVCLDVDHPEIEEFIDWKKKEEKKAKALIHAGYSSDFEGEAYRTVSGQNSNNSVRLPDSFLKAVEQDKTWSTVLRTNRKKYRSLSARGLFHKMAEAAWHCADPGLQFDTTINQWHTCSHTDRIRASNPCSEYLFLDDSACNLASLNLMKFLKDDGSFDCIAFQSACRTFLIAQEILVGLSSYPTQKIAENSARYRPLGLGYANLGALMMSLGIPYDSDLARSWCSSITALLSAEAYCTSAELAANKGPFEGYRKNRLSMQSVIERHNKAFKKVTKLCPPEIWKTAQSRWSDAVKLGKKFGFRNAQTTVLAPTGTIGLLMDCDTTGIEPEFSLVKWKKLAGGGAVKIVNRVVPTALKKLGYDENTIQKILLYCLGSGSFQHAPHLNQKELLDLGFSSEDLLKMEKSLSSVMRVEDVFFPHFFSENTKNFLQKKFKRSDLSGRELLLALGISPEKIDKANAYICGWLCLEGCPDLKPEHLSIFDCANKNGFQGKRFLPPISHLKMMAAAQPFLSGGISKTVNLPHETTAKEIESLFLQAWKLGLKSISIYRDGSKASQPLSSTSGGGQNEDSLDQRKKSEPAQVSLDSSLKKEGMEQFSLLASEDAPKCTFCGHTTVRDGSCYRCLECGNSTECSS